MTFNANCPLPGDYLSQSQAELLANNGQLNIVFGNDHVNYDNTLPVTATVADRGKHQKATLIERTAGMIPDGVDAITAVNEVALYAKDTGGISTLYMRKENNGTVVQMSGPDPVSASPGQTFLPGGLIMKWGVNAIGSGAGGTPIAFAAAFPNNLLNVQVTPVDPNAHYASVSVIGVGGFNARGSAAINIYWVAIGN